MVRQETLRKIVHYCNMLDEKFEQMKIEAEKKREEYLIIKAAKKKKEEEDRVANIAEIKNIISDFAGALTPRNMIEIFIKESYYIAVYSSGEHIIKDINTYSGKNKIVSLDEINHYSSVMIIEELRGSYLRINVRRVDPPVGLTRTEVCCELP